MDNSNVKWSFLWQKQFPFGKPRCVVTTAICPVLATIVQDLPVGSVEPEWIVSMLHVLYMLHGRLFWTLTHQVCDSIGRAGNCCSRETSNVLPSTPMLMSGLGCSWRGNSFLLWDWQRNPPWSCQKVSKGSPATYGWQCFLQEPCQPYWLNHCLSFT